MRPVKKSRKKRPAKDNNDLAEDRIPLDLFFRRPHVEEEDDVGIEVRGEVTRAQLRGLGVDY